MYLFLILFFVSLLGIAFMIGRKILVLGGGIHHHHLREEDFLSEVLDVEKVKHTAVKNFRQFLHLTVWTTLRLYIISVHLIKKTWKEIVDKIKEKMNRHKKAEKEATTAEPSKYLNMISEYREKLRKMKHRIKQEEGIE